jgi:hypothetical protein
MKTITENIIDGLRNAATELEKLQVQAALGKAEARDRYEEARGKFTTLLNEATGAANEKYKDLKPVIESLKVQFALGKAETKDVLEKQRRRFFQAVGEVEAYFKNEEKK